MGNEEMTGAAEPTVTVDLRDAIEAPGRAQEIEEGRRFLRAGDTPYVLYQYVSLTGRVMGKMMPARHFQRVALAGLRFHPGGVTDWAQTRSGRSIGYAAEAAELIALPDLGTLQRLPWDPEFAICTCDLYRRPEIGVESGQAFGLDARGFLKRVSDEFRTATGLTVKSGCEPEITWFESDGCQPVTSGDLPHHIPSSAYHVEHLSRMRGVIKRVCRYATELGFDMIEGDYEDPGQLELNFAFDECVQTADRLVLLRQICAQVARELDLRVTFMPKPFAGQMANGCHHNLSLWRNDENVMCDANRTELHLSSLAGNALAGILEHAPGMLAVGAPTTNSYARFWDQGQFAPAVRNWGYDNKTCAVRVPGIGRLEYKMPDSAANPYLTHGLLIAAIWDGIDRGLEPGEPVSTTSYEDRPADAADALPSTLAEALAALAADPVLVDALGTEMAAVFEELKQEEWARACGAVTDFDREAYFDVLP